ncbi:MAG: GPR endopeptidase [Ruminococcaceae bacterium]|nr:GPR endopeptidase [Oscillospiraceae bacterium]
MNFRTDLALERHESVPKSSIEGIELTVKECNGIKVTHITVTNEKGEKAIGKKMGRYITAELPGLERCADNMEQWSKVLADEIRSLIPKYGTVLVAGLGNRDITPDAIGPECISHLLATRHIKGEAGMPESLSGLRSVAGLVPGVLGNTGIETAEILKGVVSKIEPSAVIVIDALASRSLSRLGTTVQLCDTGVSPGSGVGNRRKEINSESLGVPVIAIGVPTVVDGITLALDLIEECGVDLAEEKRRRIVQSEKGMMVTPKEIDLTVKRAARLISLSVNRALQSDMSASDITAIVSTV